MLFSNHFYTVVSFVFGTSPHTCITKQLISKLHSQLPKHTVLHVSFSPIFLLCVSAGGFYATNCLQNRHLPFTQHFWCRWSAGRSNKKEKKEVFREKQILGRQGEGEKVGVDDALRRIDFVYFNGREETAYSSVFLVWLDGSTPFISTPKRFKDAPSGNINNLSVGLHVVAQENLWCRCASTLVPHHEWCQPQHGASFFSLLCSPEDLWPCFNLSQEQTIPHLMTSHIRWP